MKLEELRFLSVTELEVSRRRGSEGLIYPKPPHGIRCVREHTKNNAKEVEIRCGVRY